MTKADGRREKMDLESRSPWGFAVMNYVICKQLYDHARHCGLSLSDGMKWESACFGAQVQAWHDREIERLMHQATPPPFYADGKLYRYVGPL
jgi:hypothetical protein